MNKTAAFILPIFALSTAMPVQAQTVDYGDNSSEFANDGQCDDMRFSGPGMAAFLIEGDIGHDATDCRKAIQDGTIEYLGPQGVRTMSGDRPPASSITFGDNSSQWANDGECDDKRFRGPGMTLTMLLDDDIGHDANDCRSAYDDGRLGYLGNGSASVTAPAPTPTGQNQSRIIWGDDSSQFARDGECDDMRFTGSGMTDTPLLESDVKHDATDCRVAFEQGRIQLRD